MGEIKNSKTRYFQRKTIVSQKNNFKNGRKYVEKVMIKA